MNTMYQEPMSPMYSVGLQRRSNFWIQLSIYSGSFWSYLNKSLYRLRLFLQMYCWEHGFQLPNDCISSSSASGDLVPLCVIFSFLRIMTSRLSDLHSNLLGTFSRNEIPPKMTNPVIILVTAPMTINFWKRFPKQHLFLLIVFPRASSNSNLYICYIITL